MSESTRLATESMCKSRMFVVYIYIFVVYILYMPSVMDVCAVCVTVKSRMTRA